MTVIYAAATQWCDYKLLILMLSVPVLLEWQ